MGFTHFYIQCQVGYQKSTSPAFYVETEQRGMDMDFGVEQTRVCIPVLAHTVCVAFDHLLNLSELSSSMKQIKQYLIELFEHQK